MISLKDYAKQNNVTYEAVRKQVARYKEQLDDHIIQDGRTQYLDDIAVAFLDERRKKNPVVVYQQSKDEAIDRLEKENKMLLAKLAAKSEAVEQLMQYKLEAEENKRALEDARTAQARRERELQEREDGFNQEVLQARQEAAEAAREAAAAEKELLEGFIADAKAEIATLSGEKAQAEGKAREAEEAAQTAQKELTEARQDLADRDARIRELENRSFWQILMDYFRR